MNKSTETEWRNISWKTSKDNVRKWQLLIYKASKEGNRKEVRRLQHIVLGLLDSKLLAVRQITQDNKGKNTPGVDGKSSYRPEERIGLAKSLKTTTPGKPLKRILIPKPGTDDPKYSHPKRQMSSGSLQIGLGTRMGSEFWTRLVRRGRGCYDAVAAVPLVFRKVYLKCGYIEMLWPNWSWVSP